MTSMQTLTAHCRLVPIQDGLPRDVIAVWEELLAQLPEAPVFVHPQWYDCLFRAHVSRPWGVLIFREGDRPVGLLPLERRTAVSAIVPAPISHDTPPLLITPGAEGAVWAGLAYWLRHEAPIGLLRLGNFNCEDLAALQEQFKALGLYSFIKPAYAAMWATLPASWEAYLQVLSSSARYKVRRSLKQFYDDFADTELTVESTPAGCAAAMDDLFRLSHLRWHGAEMRSYLDNPYMARFYREAMAWAVGQGYGHLGVLRAGGRTVGVATLLYIPGQQAAYYHVVARDTTELPNRYSPGIVVAAHLIKWAIAHGATRISLGQLAVPYKVLLGGVEYAQCAFHLARSATAAAFLRPLDTTLWKTKSLVARAVPRSLRALLRRAP